MGVSPMRTAGTALLRERQFAQGTWVGRFSESSRQARCAGSDKMHVFNP